ncbi:hypothetical protein QBC46DRAFT_458585 [Diplogelasinospora grovesii]|uniref:NB-ARC domain-containing protein n=1 Tax=Diplogelasinospora grovesii TaxID=303347 RepID=A0AAN6N8X8_9PEZI|nr:hypothetical protein QBC46DRAFT_458585 [Diplogelasinospora grovesii]
MLRGSIVKGAAVGRVNSAKLQIAGRRAGEAEWADHVQKLAYSRCVDTPNAAAVLFCSNGSAMPFATIPFCRDPDFVNRGDILEQIHQRCSEPADRVALVGLGGVGKSQLAIEFAHRIAAGPADTWVFWVHAGTQARVEEGFTAIAHAVKLAGRNQPKANIPQLVYGWLSNEGNGRWMIILDSADDRDVFYGASSDRERQPLVKYLPQSRNGSIMVTTRDKDLAFRLTGNHRNIIEVGPIQAAAYIQARAPRSSVEGYLAKFREGERYDAGDLRRDGGASNAILTTWQISFNHICSKRPTAADLLSLMSFFENSRTESVPKEGRTQNQFH